MSVPFALYNKDAVDGRVLDIAELGVLARAVSHASGELRVITNHTNSAVTRMSMALAKAAQAKRDAACEEAQAEFAAAQGSEVWPTDRDGHRLVATVKGHVDVLCAAPGGQSPSRAMEESLLQLEHIELYPTPEPTQATALSAMSPEDRAAAISAMPPKRRAAAVATMSPEERADMGYPTPAPTAIPTATPTADPTATPTATPTHAPTHAPTVPTEGAPPGILDPPKYGRLGVGGSGSTKLHRKATMHIFFGMQANPNPNTNPNTRPPWTPSSAHRAPSQ